MFKDMNLGNQVVRGAEFIIRDPSVDGPRMVRSTLAAVLLDDGRLFIGCATCSESEQFVKADGRAIALNQAHAKASKAVGGSSVMPDALVAIELRLDNLDADVKKLNKIVKEECLYYQLEAYREMLFNRSRIIEQLEEELAFHGLTRV